MNTTPQAGFRDRLEEVLRPFAALADYYDKIQPNLDGREPLFTTNRNEPIRLRDLRAARAFLAGVDGEATPLYVEGYFNDRVLAGDRPPGDAEARELLERLDRALDFDAQKGTDRQRSDLLAEAMNAREFVAKALARPADDVERVAIAARAIMQNERCGLTLKGGERVFCDDPRVPDDVRMGDCECKTSAEAVIAALASRDGG